MDDVQNVTATSQRQSQSSASAGGSPDQALISASAAVSSLTLTPEQLQQIIQGAVSSAITATLAIQNDGPREAAS